jgi:hypothetical protein
MAARKKAEQAPEPEVRIVSPDTDAEPTSDESPAYVTPQVWVDLRHADTGYVAGPGVRPLQRLLGVAVDGRAGRRTRGALWSLQTRLGVDADFVFGPVTAAAAFTQVD